MLESLIIWIPSQERKFSENLKEYGMNEKKSFYFEDRDLKFGMFCDFWPYKFCFGRQIIPHRNSI